MNTTGKATFKTTAWDEKTYLEIDGERKLTRTQAIFTYEGDLDGQGAVEYLMSYCLNGLGNFVGLERIEGRLNGMTGSYVVQHTGTFDPQSVMTHWEIVPGSGTGELEGLVGSGDFVLAGHGPYSITFEYRILFPEGVAA